MNDIVQRAVSLLEREGFIKEAEAVEAQAAEIERYRTLALQNPSWERAEAAEAEVKRLREALENIDAVAVDFGHYESAARTMKEHALKALGVKP